MRFIFLVISIYSLKLWADQNSFTHMLRTSYGYTYYSEAQYKEGADEHSTKTQASIQYAYQLPSAPQYQLLAGAYLYYKNYNANNENQNELPSWGRRVDLTFGFIYNFDETLVNSLYVSYYTYIYGQSRNTSGYPDLQFPLTFGKRFQLDYFGLQFASYSPQITFLYQEYEDFNRASLSFTYINFEYFF